MLGLGWDGVRRLKNISKRRNRGPKPAWVLVTVQGSLDPAIPGTWWGLRNVKTPKWGWRSEGLMVGILGCRARVRNPDVALVWVACEPSRLSSWPARHRHNLQLRCHLLDVTFFTTETDLFTLSSVPLQHFLPAWTLTWLCEYVFVSWPPLVDFKTLWKATTPYISLCLEQL